MNSFLVNLVLALVWAALLGSTEAVNLFVGFVLGYLLLWVLEPLEDSRAYVRKLPMSAAFALFFLRELTLSTLRVGWEVITPTRYRKPGIIALPLSVETDAEITMLANLITLTPGTLSLDVSDDRGTLYIHAMFVDDEQELVRDIKEGFERRVLELLR